MAVQRPVIMISGEMTNIVMPNAFWNTKSRIKAFGEGIDGITSTAVELGTS